MIVKLVCVSYYITISPLIIFVRIGLQQKIREQSVVTFLEIWGGKNKTEMSYKLDINENEDSDMKKNIWEEIS